MVGSTRLSHCPKRFIGRVLAAMARNVGIALAFVLAVFDLLIPDPAVFSFRIALVVVLAATGTLAGGVAFRLGRRKTAVALATAAALAVYQGLQPRIAEIAVLGDQGSESISVERHFVVGFESLRQARDFVRNGHVGGVFITQRNIIGNSIVDLAKMVADLQAIRHAAGLPPLIVAADQEGGPVSHLSPPLPRPPALSTIAGLDLSRQYDAALRLGMAQGSALSEVGVTMDLAPVSDLTPSDPSGWLDLHTRLATRSISADWSVAATVASGFAQGLRDRNVMPTAKHFPGLGRVATDTHLFGASLDAAEDDLRMTDWVPFQAVLRVPGAAVMLSHVALDRVDADVPASQSKRVITGILRNGWGFNGIAITDDLTMGAVAHTGLCHAVEGGLNAGVDLLLVSWDTDKVFPALQCALDAFKAGRLDRHMLEASIRRLDALAGGNHAKVPSGAEDR